MLSNGKSSFKRKSRLFRSQSNFQPEIREGEIELTRLRAYEKVLWGLSDERWNILGTMGELEGDIQHDCSAESSNLAELIQTGTLPMAARRLC